MDDISAILNLLQCPASGQLLRLEGDRLVSEDGQNSYPLSATGIPCFAGQLLSEDARVQQEQFDRIGQLYSENMSYPHTQEYYGHLDHALLDCVEDDNLGVTAEICCGRGEAFDLIQDRVGLGVGVDISLWMLESARPRFPPDKIALVQGDATNLPLKAGRFDSVFMQGGIHHVNDRHGLFSEIFRILKPGGRLFFREPLDDFFLWRWIRKIIYRVSPLLDFDTERPLRREETIPILEDVGLEVRFWKSYGFIGGCIFLNSDVLVANRCLRFLPGIRTLTRFSARMDDKILALPGLSNAGLQVIGVAQKPTS